MGAGMELTPTCVVRMARPRVAVNCDLINCVARCNCSIGYSSHVCVCVYVELSHFRCNRKHVQQPKRRRDVTLIRLRRVSKL